MPSVWNIHPVERALALFDKVIYDCGRQTVSRPFNLRKDRMMKASVTNFVMAIGFVAIGVAIGAAGIYIGDTDDAPGAALLGLLLMIGAVALAVRTARRTR